MKQLKIKPLQGDQLPIDQLLPDAPTRSAHRSKSTLQALTVIMARDTLIP